MSDICKMDSGFKINNLLLLESRSRLNHYTSSEFYCEPESLGRFILLQELRVKSCGVCGRCGILNSWLWYRI